MNTKKFQRKKENFTCLNCRKFVRGNGYTNHCPECLWSLHVDINPGDRKYFCRGLMEPKEILKEKGVYSVVHKCQKCGLEKKNKIVKNDNFEKVIEISEVNKR